MYVSAVSCGYVPMGYPLWPWPWDFAVIDKFADDNDHTQCLLYTKNIFGGLYEPRTGLLARLKDKFCELSKKVK